MPGSIGAGEPASPQNATGGLHVRQGCEPVMARSPAGAVALLLFESPGL